MGFFGWIIMGLVGGAIGKAITGKSMGWIATLITGIVGGIVGGWLGGAIFGGEYMTSFFSLAAWICAIVGSVIVIWVVSLFTGRNKQNA